MNKIEKNPQIPEILQHEGVELTKALCARNPEEITNKDFVPEIYGAVKEQLKADQHSKCVYCEQLLNGDFGHVEHYRPKASYRTTLLSKKDVKPAYYWLAYNWDNLLCSCSECNTSFKKTYFPLADEKQRDIEHRDISKEVPLIINPAKEDPGEHIVFRRYVATAKINENGHKSLKGETTIAILKLNDRELLVNKRRIAWKNYSDALRLYEIGKTLECKDVMELAKKIIMRLTNPYAEFTGMFKYQFQ